MLCFILLCLVIVFTNANIISNEDIINLSQSLDPNCHNKFLFIMNIGNNKSVVVRNNDSDIVKNKESNLVRLSFANVIPVVSFTKAPMEFVPLYPYGFQNKQYDPNPGNVFIKVLRCTIKRHSNKDTSSK